MNQIECFIGCSACGTVLFRVEREERRPGSFEHVQVPLVDGVSDHLKCGKCGGDLVRVPAPIVSRETI